MNRALIGWGAIVIGVVLFCPAVFEILSGTFQPHGYPRASSWVPRVLGELFGPLATYITGAVWLALGIGFIALGVRELRHRQVIAREQRGME
jgi:hypothetical protein